MLVNTFNRNGKISTVNSTNTPLGSSASFVGVWEDVSLYDTISIIFGTDVNGIIYAEFSTDGTDTLPTYRKLQLSDGVTPFFGVNNLSIVAQYFRITIDNDSIAQTELDVQVMYHVGSLISMPTSRAAQSISDYTDVLNMRLLSDPLLDEIDGRQIDRQAIQKFGSNQSVAAGVLEDIWYGGGLYTGFLTSAQQLRIAAGGDINDDASGTNARSVTINGLDSNWNIITETINTNGTLVSSLTTNTFIRVFRAWVEDVGTYGETNAGDIIIETSSSDTVASIQANRGQTQLAIYTIPEGWIGFVRRLGAGVDGNKQAQILFFQRQNADVVTAPMQGKRLMHEFSELSGTITLDLKSYLGPFPSRTDIWASAIGPSGGAAISASFDIVLIRN